MKKRSIDDDLRQLALIRQDCVLASLQVMLNIFFQFSKKWVGRAIGNETFYGDGLSYLLATGNKVSFLGKVIFTFKSGGFSSTVQYSTVQISLALPKGTYQY